MKRLGFSKILSKLDRFEQTDYGRVLCFLRWPDKALRLLSTHLSCSAGDPAGAQHSSATADKRKRTDLSAGRHSQWIKTELRV